MTRPSLTRLIIAVVLCAACAGCGDKPQNIAQGIQPPKYARDSYVRWNGRGWSYDKDNDYQVVQVTGYELAGDPGDFSWRYTATDRRLEDITCNEESLLGPSTYEDFQKGVSDLMAKESRNLPPLRKAIEAHRDEGDVRLESHVTIDGLLIDLDAKPRKLKVIRHEQPPIKVCGHRVVEAYWYSWQDNETGEKVSCPAPRDEVVATVEVPYDGKYESNAVGFGGFMVDGGTGQLRITNNAILSSKSMARDYTEESIRQQIEWWRQRESNSTESEVRE